MKNIKLIAILLIVILITSCSKEITDRNGNFDQVVNYELNDDLENKIGNYAHKFYNNFPDVSLNFDYSYGNNIEIRPTIGGEKFYKVPLESSVLEIEDFVFDGYINDYGRYKFIPEDAEPLLWRGSGYWLQEFDFTKLEDRKINVKLFLDNKQFVNDHVGYFGPTMMSVAGGTESEQFPGHIVANKNNFTLSWNKAIENTDGVLLVIRGVGTNSNNVFGEPSNAVTLFYLLKDDGYQTLESSLFDGMASGDFFQIEVYRGQNKVIVAEDGTTINLSANAIDYLPLIIE